MSSDSHHELCTAASQLDRGCHAEAAFLVNHETDVLGELVAQLLHADRGRAKGFVAALLQAGLSARSLMLDLFEPAARRLGDQWLTDACSSVELTIALARLQAIAFDLDGGASGPDGDAPSPSVLVAQLPGETHAFTLAPILYASAGFRVAWESPSDTAALSRLLRSQRVNVLDLTLSPALQRVHRLPLLAEWIIAARAVRLSSPLLLIASGRLFAEQPELALLAGADMANPGAQHGAATVRAHWQAMQFSTAFAKVQQAIVETGAAVGRGSFGERLEAPRR